MKTLKAVVAKYNQTSLILRILIGLAVGSVLALVAPGAGWVGELGNLFVGALKGIAPVLVFVIVASALAQGSSKLDRRFGTVIWLYMLTTFLAAAIAVITSFMFPVTVVLADAAQSNVIPQGLGEVLSTLLTNFVANPVSALMNGNYIGILFWACMFGIAMKNIGAESTKVFLANTADAVSQIVRWIINLAPFGIMGLVYTNVSGNGLAIFTQYGKLLALLVGMPRLFMLVQVAPFMGGNILTGQLRTTVVFACYLILHPAIVASLPETQGLSPSTFALYGAILVKETLIGMLLGYLSGMLFWTIQCAGFFIDNQRGASMAEGADPLSGEQTSPLGSFFFQSAVYLFFSTGAFLALLGVVYASYEIWPVTQLIPLSVFKDINLPLFFAGRVSWLLLMMLLLSGPIVVACLLTDVSLGLINRFASQLNVYVLAMPIKSGVAAFLMLFYFMMLLSNATGLFDGVKADFEQLRRLLP